MVVLKFLKQLRFALTFSVKYLLLAFNAWQSCVNSVYRALTLCYVILHWEKIPVGHVIRYVNQV
jgi:hypothetical protein